MGAKFGISADTGRAYRSSWRLWFVGLVLIVITALGCTLAIWDLHRQTIEQQRVALRNLGVVLAEQMLRYMQLVDLPLREMQSRVAARDVRTPDVFVHDFGSLETRGFLLDRLGNLPQANAFLLLGPDGHAFLSTRSQAARATDFSDRDYFRHFTTQHDDGPYVSEPLISRVAGTPAIYLARSIEAADHTLLGVAVAAIDLQYLADFYRAIDLPEGETVTLLRRDGLVLARYPDPTHEVGKRMAAASPWHGLAAGQGGTYRSPGFLGSVRGIVAVRPLAGWPLVIDVSVQEPVVLAKWRHQATIIALIGAGTAVGFAVLFGMIGWQFRRQAEDNARLAETASALRASEARVSDFAQMSSDWLWETDTEMRFTLVSDCSMTRAMDVKKQLGHTPWELFGGDPEGPRWEPVRSAVQARQPFRDFRDGEIDPGGVHHFVSINGMPVFDAAGAFIGYRGTGREITADVAAAHELELAKERAEAASRAKSEFLASMSHELRTPLNAVIGFSELIRDQPADRGNANHAEFANEINNAGHHLLEMINDVLDLSKIEAGCYVLADETVELGVVVRACINMLKLRAKAGGVRIENRVNGMRYALRGDARALQQVVLNLLSNAVKFTPGGGVVSLSMEPDDNGATLLVRDTGIGIDVEVVRRLGQPFQQADASISRKYGGSGLGLAISRKLLALHGATLSMESELGVGTTVRVGFPRERVLGVTPAARASVATA